MVFPVEFDLSLNLQGFEGISGGIMVIFDGVKSGEMLDFSEFCRSGYRSENGGLGVETSDMPFSAIEYLFWNVNYAPYLALKDTIIVQYYGIFYFSTLKR